MKMVISKNKDGNGYYTKLSNEYNNQKSEMYMSLQIPKGNHLPRIDRTLNRFL